MRPINDDICILQGATLSKFLQWCSSDPTHKAITNVQVGLPTLVTVPGHGLTGRTSVWITNVRGPRDLNTDGYRNCPPQSASVVDADTLAIDFDSGSLSPYQSGGVLTYYPPLDLTGYTGRMQVRANQAAQDVLLELTTENGGINITGPTGTIEMRSTAAATAALTFGGGVYDLELTATDGFVTRLAQGAVTVSREVTR